VLRTVVWVVGGIVALDLTLVMLIAVYAVVDRARSRREIRDLEEIWELSPRSSRTRQAGFTWPLGGRVTAALAIAALIVAGTAVASPGARHMVASMFGSVARQLGIGERDVDEGAERLGGTAETSLTERAGSAPAASVGSAGGDRRSRAAHGGAPPSTGATSGSSGSRSGPISPTSVTAAPSSSSQIDLAWTDVSGESGYRLERSLDGLGGWTAVATADADATGYHDVGLASSTTYFYRVFATDPAGDSPPSGIASATTSPDPPNPTTITTLTASSTEVDLEWLDVSGETGYRIERSVDDATWITIATTGQDVTTYQDGGLAPGTAYTYRVVASNAGGDSLPSGVASVTTSTDSSPAEVDPTPAAVEPTP
jgi:hypothetical protein